jgi:hypothetical protein
MNRSLQYLHQSRGHNKNKLSRRLRLPANFLFEVFERQSLLMKTTPRSFEAGKPKHYFANWPTLEPRQTLLATNEQPQLSERAPWLLLSSEPLLSFENYLAARLTRLSLVPKYA